MERPMSPDAALGFATCYAERKKIPIVYVGANIPIVYVGAASGRDLF
jgi:hypothetical protein